MAGATIRLVGVGDVLCHFARPGVFARVAPALGAADVTFGNCEWPHSEEAGDTHPVEAHLNDLVDEGDLFLPGDPASVALFGQAGFDVMSFANNHCLHAGYRAFLRTMALLREAGIEPVGAGRNIVEAHAPVVIERGGTRIAFLACASAFLPGTHAGRRVPGIAILRRHSYFENPAWENWGTAPDIRTLVNREDLARMCQGVRQARETADVVVVSCHWGILEDRVAIGHYQREAAHALIDAGADLILGHGPLVTKGIEVYRGKAIFYCLGKFVMVAPVPVGATPIGVNVPFGAESRKGIAAVVEIADGRIARVAFRPVHAGDDGAPYFPGGGTPIFEEIAGDIARITAAAHLPAAFAIEGDEVRVTAGDEG